MSWQQDSRQDKSWPTRAGYYHTVRLWRAPRELKNHDEDYLPSEQLLVDPVYVAEFHREQDARQKVAASYAKTLELNRNALKKRREAKN